MKYWFLLIACAAVFSGTAQNKDRVSVCLTAQYNTTLYDATKPNNQAGPGIGAQVVFNYPATWRPVLELTADAYWLDDKVYRLAGPNDSTFQGMETAREMLTFAGGMSCHPGLPFFFSLSAGVAVVNRQASPLMRASAGLYFSKSRRWMAKISYLNIFNRYRPTGQDFGALSLMIGLKLF